jgi:hypothetical protein
MRRDSPQISDPGDQATTSAPIANPETPSSLESGRPTALVHLIAQGTNYLGHSDHLLTGESTEGGKSDTLAALETHHNLHLNIQADKYHLLLSFDFEFKRDAEVAREGTEAEVRTCGGVGNYVGWGCNYDAWYSVQEEVIVRKL